MWKCKYCGKKHNIAENDYEAQAKHIESKHHLPAMRTNETEEEALERFRSEHAEAGSDTCKCPACSTGREQGRARGRDHTSPEQRDGSKPF